MDKIDFYEARRILRRVTFASRLEEVFGPVKKCSQWKWIAIEIPEESGIGLIPCAISTKRKKIRMLGPWLDKSLTKEKIQEVFEYLNPFLDDEELEKLQEMSREIFRRANIAKESHEVECDVMPQRDLRLWLTGELSPAELAWHEARGTFETKRVSEPIVYYYDEDGSLKPHPCEDYD